MCFSRQILLGLGLSALLGGGDKVIQCLWFSHCHIGEHLAVNLYALFLQGINELAIFDSLGSGGGINAGNPQSPHIALSLAAVSEGIGQGFEHGLVGTAH